LHQLSVFQFRHQLTFKETSLKIAEYIFVLFIKLLSLPRFPRRYFRKRKLGRWEIYIYRKDVYLTFCLWHFRISQVLETCQKQSNSRCLRGMFIPLVYFFFNEKCMLSCYTYRRGLLRCSFRQVGQCESLEVWDE